MATIDQVTRGVAAFADAELLNKLPAGGVKKFGIGMVMTLAIANMDKIVRTGMQHPMASLLGIGSADGTINLDAVAEAAKKNIGDEGLKVNLSLLGFTFGDVTFHRSDVDTLRSYIMNA